MAMTALVIGAYLAGHVVPELALAMGGRADIVRVPLALNVMTGVAAALIAYGLRA